MDARSEASEASRGPESAATEPSDASIIVGALYGLAADPAEWSRFVQALQAGAPADAAEQVRLAAMVAGGERVAELASRTQLAGDMVEPVRAAVWIVSLAGLQLAANSEADASTLAAFFAAPESGPASERQEILRSARAGLKVSAGEARLISLAAGDASLPAFAYAMDPAQLPSALRAGLPGSAVGSRGAMAIVAPAVASETAVWDGLTASFGLTPAEIRLAARLREGASLQQAAQALNVSVNTVRNQLTAIFEKIGVNRQSELVRALSELGPLSRRLQRSPVRERAAAAALDAPAVEVVRLPDGRRLAFREYGPPQGQPVLVFHGGLGASLLPPGTEGDCQDLGLRLIVPERAGTGRSDPNPDHRIDTAAEDIAWLSEDLRLGPMQYCSLTSGARFALAAAERSPQAVGRILMLTPRPPSDPSRATRPTASPMVALERRIKAHPWLADSLFAIARLRLSRPIISQIMQASAISRGDAAYLAEHPETVDHITTALQEALRETGQGTADEIRESASQGPRADTAGSPPITVWHGQEDAYVSPKDVEAWLGPRLSAFRVVPAIGNYLILKHWSEALAWLADD